MRLAHLSLSVGDQQRSRRVYETFFDFAFDPEPDAEGCLHLTDVDGFDLTLAARPMVSPSPAPSLHCGIKVADADSVRRLRVRLARESVQTGDLFESESRVAFQCVDPDGYQLEVFSGT